MRKLDVLDGGWAGIERFRPSPLQVRTEYREDQLQELADDISRQGVLLPLLCRTWKGEPDVLEIVAGHRRHLAAQRAGIARLPYVLRDDMTDSQVVAAMLGENGQRADLTRVEQAWAFLKLRELGLKQLEISSQCGFSVPYVSKTLALLALPTPVLAMVQAGRLSPSHAEELLRFRRLEPTDHRDRLVIRMAELMVEKGLSANQCATGVPGQWTLKEEGLIRELSAHQSTTFDWREICKSCPHNALVGTYCLYPAHAAELDAAAKVEAAREAHRIRAEFGDRGGMPLAMQAMKPAKEPAGLSPGKADTDNGPTVYTSRLPYDAYTEIRGGSRPAGCNEAACGGKGGCLVRGAINSAGQVVDICMKPRRYSSLQSAPTREVRSHKRERLTQQREQLLRHLRQAPEITTRELAPLVHWLIQGANGNGVKEKDLRLAFEFAGIQLPALLFCGSIGKALRPQVYRFLSGLSLPQLLHCCLFLISKAELEEEVTYGDKPRPRTYATAFLLGIDDPTQPADAWISDSDKLRADATLGTLGLPPVFAKQKAEPPPPGLHCDACKRQVEAGVILVPVGGRLCCPECVPTQWAEWLELPAAEAASLELLRVRRAALERCMPEQLPARQAQIDWLSRKIERLLAQAKPSTEPVTTQSDEPKPVVQKDDPAPRCVECSLALGTPDAGTGVPIGKGKLLCGQCSCTREVRAKHGLPEIPAEGWARAKKPSRLGDWCAWTDGETERVGTVIRCAGSDGKLLIRSNGVPHEVDKSEATLRKIEPPTTAPPDAPAEVQASRLGDGFVRLGDMLQQRVDEPEVAAALAALEAGFDQAPPEISPGKPAGDLDATAKAFLTRHPDTWEIPYQQHPLAADSQLTATAKVVYTGQDGAECRATVKSRQGGELHVTVHLPATARRKKPADIPMIFTDQWPRSMRLE